jgi:hypothetical protein
MDWKEILLKAMLMLLERFGPSIIEAIGDLILALIKSMTPEQKAKLAKNVGVPDEIIKECFKTA